MHLGATRIEADGRARGMYNGTLTIAAGQRVEVSGMVNGTLVVEPGAEVFVTGMINGAIDNRGGTVRVSGMVVE